MVKASSPVCRILEKPKNIAVEFYKGTAKDL